MKGAIPAVYAVQDFHRIPGQMADSVTQSWSWQTDNVELRNVVARLASQTPIASSDTNGVRDDD